MAGLDRFVSVLRVFDEAKSDWTVQDIAGAVGVPTSTAYRTVRELVAHGFLEPSIEAHYRLGSAFVEFDRLIRLTDPLVRAGGPLLRDLVAEARLPSVAVLARLYGDRVICASDGRSDGADIATSYERGRPMPLMRGATSKAILCQLPGRRLKRLLAGAGPDVMPQAIGTFQEELIAIRRRGFCVTRGEVDEGLVGLAAPIASSDYAISASISLVVRAADLDGSAERRLVLLLVSSANLVSEALSKAGAADGTAAA